MFKRFCVLSGLSILAVTTACSPTHVHKEEQFWQRISASETVYIRGPKAQQILNRDIANCVTTLKELERLGQLHDTIPTDHSGRVLDPDELELSRRDNPDYDGPLHAEHLDYHDFESCMMQNGWERTTSVPFDARARAHENYMKNHVDHIHRHHAHISEKAHEGSHALND